jgi:hypothetical protein
VNTLQGSNKQAASDEDRDDEFIDYSDRDHASFPDAPDDQTASGGRQACDAGGAGLGEKRYADANVIAL